VHMRDLSLLVSMSSGYSPSPSVCATATPGSIAAMSPPATRLVMDRFFTKLSPYPPGGHAIPHGAQPLSGAISVVVSGRRPGRDAVGRHTLRRATASVPP